MIVKQLIMALRDQDRQVPIWKTDMDLSPLSTLGKHPGLVFCYSALMSVGAVLHRALSISGTDALTATCCVQVEEGLELREQYLKEKAEEEANIAAIEAGRGAPVVVVDTTEVTTEVEEDNEEEIDPELQTLMDEVESGSTPPEPEDK